MLDLSLRSDQSLRRYRSAARAHAGFDGVLSGSADGYSARYRLAAVLAVLIVEPEIGLSVALGSSPAPVRRARIADGGAR